jgi:hypothetical protein
MKFVFVNRLDIEVLKKNPEIKIDTSIRKLKPFSCNNIESIVKKIKKESVVAKDRTFLKPKDGKTFYQTFKKMGLQLPESKKRGGINNYLFQIRSRKLNYQNVKNIDDALSVLDYKYNSLILKINDSDRYNAFLIDDSTVLNANGRTILMYCKEEKAISPKGFYEKFLASDETLNAPIAVLKYSTDYEPETLGDWLGEQLKQCVG